MSAAVTIADIERYDTACAFCGDGEPQARIRGKAACAPCFAAMREGGISETGELAVSPWRERELIRYLLGLGPRDYPRPLFERALEARGTQLCKRAGT